MCDTSIESPKVAWFKRHIWLTGCDLETEHKQAAEEGRDLTAVEAEFQRLLAVTEKRDEAWYEAAGALLDKVPTLPRRAGYSWIEPSDLAGIRAARPAPPPLKPWRGSRARFQQKLHGGLLGRICGCLLGKPVEGWNRESIRITGAATRNWPLADYLRQPTARERKLIEQHRPRNKFTSHGPPANWLRGKIHGMVEDDDLNYTTTGFAIVKRWGVAFTPLDVASFWGENLPIFHTCTAERVAYRNFASGLPPPASATYRNPYREWIGAQIRADYFGYANPGQPARAAEWAWRDACVSHIKNGIYGEMWVAAMLAAAYVETDWIKIIQAGLAQVPARSRLRADVEKIIRAAATRLSYDQAVELVHQQWNESRGHDWCHTNSNAQLVAIGLLYGEDDYEKTVTRAVMPGFDTDCNGATCGSLWGVKHGVGALPRKWTAPIHDLLRTGVAGYHQVKISQLAADMVATALKTNP